MARIVTPIGLSIFLSPYFCLEKLLLQVTYLALGDCPDSSLNKEKN
ncbi:hypothetical protein [Methanosarcina sp. KYL-1]|nr:hypothetical protein [Methanosarcina sp. KYL-1]